MPLTGVTVLAVDDNEIHHYALVKTLQQSGAVVLSAYTGDQTLRQAACKPDLILLDVNLPDIKGFDVCRKLKNDPDTAEIPVVFISATHQNTMSRNIAESVGARAYLFHPVERQHLIATIQGQLKR